ncbi:amidohydrolase [Kineococcus gynurae]|uniref:Amidohydrolase n=1 Tax=Kineococcus gynurae TaxID=452979 RepID=A0ABV5LRT3_9ACTN
MLLRDVRLGAEGPRVDVRVRDGVVDAVGPGLADDGTGRPGEEDLGGGVLLPGLRDEHVHLTQWAVSRRRVDLSATTSPQEAARTLAGAGPGTELLVGQGFRDALWSEPAHRAVLDEQFGDRPVVAVSQDLHCAWVNSAAARQFGVTEPTGVVREDEAMRLLTEAGTLDPGTADRWSLEALDEAAARGVTAVTDFELAPPTDWVRRARLRAPATRVAVGVWPDFVAATVAAGLRTGSALDPAGLVRVGPVKLFADGSLGTRTAFCSHPYPDGGHGVRRLEAEELAGWLRRTGAVGLSVAVHAIGDAAVRLALDGFAAAGTGGRIEHAQQVRVEDVPRFAALGVVASVQPRHCPDDRDAAERHWAGATGRAFCFAELLAAGAELRFGSDAPVAALDPWDAIAAAVHRSIDARPPWHPEHHLDLDDALAAASGGRRQVRVGDPADLVLLPEHPRTVLDREGAEGLRRMPVTATITAGRVVSRR